MPLYEYQCRSCDDVSEAFQRISDPPLTTCEACGGELKKLISAPAFQFKGSGWYVTDYADKPKSSEGGADGKDAKSSTDAGKKDGEAKTAKTDSSSTDKGASDKKSSKSSSADA